MPLRTPFGRATWGLDAVLIWSGGLSGFAWLLGLLQGLGVGYAFLLALAAFPLAFLSCVLVRHYRDIGQTIAAFFGRAPEDESNGALPSIGTRLRKIEDGFRALRECIDVLDSASRNHIDHSAKLHGLMRDMQRDLAGIQTAITNNEYMVRHVTEWLRRVAASQIEASRIAAIRDLQDQAPKLPQQGPDEKLQISRNWMDEAERYISVAGAALRTWRIGNPDTFQDMMQQASNAAHEWFGQIERGEPVAFGDVPDIARYVEIVKKREALEVYLKTHIEEATDRQTRELPELLSCAELDCLRQEGKI